MKPAANNPPSPAGGSSTAANNSHRLLRASRGFSCLFWSLPLLVGNSVLALDANLPMNWRLLLPPLAFLPMVCGFWLLRRSGPYSPRWGGLLERLSLLVLAAVYLSPFPLWWLKVPQKLFFAVNAGGYHLVMIGLMVGLNHLAGECGRAWQESHLKREAWAGMGLVVGLSLCTVTAVGWLFHRSGVLAAGLPAILSHLAQLPAEARYLLLLPYVSTAYIMWRAKETGFRRALQPPPSP